MRSVTLEEFVDTAPADLLEDLQELFDMACKGADEYAEFEIHARFAETRDRLRARLASN